MVKEPTMTRYLALAALLVLSACGGVPLVPLI